MVSDEALKRGILAYKNGQKGDARQYFEQVIETDEDNEKAWLLLSRVVDSDEERLICLENVLTINPGNENAQKGLSRLTIQQQEAFPDTEGWQDVNAFLAEDPPSDQPLEVEESNDVVSVEEAVKTPLYRPQPTATHQENKGGDDKILLIITAVVFLLAVVAAVIILPGLMG